MYRKYIKRLLDFFIALICLIILSPLLVVIIIWLHFANKGVGAIFTQQRLGREERAFNICKFRSMTDKRDKTGKLLPDSERLTNVGRFIRKTSLDELPQLWNVLVGDMSLIGPRPLFVRYQPFYTEREKLRHQVRPGITGLAQISGRNKLGWDDRLEKDVTYVEKLSFSLDFKIFLKTIINVLSHKDIITPGEMEVLPDLDKERRREKIL